MMKKTTLSLELAQKMYNGSDEQLKAFALENYPELGMKIIDRIKTFKDVCIKLDRNLNDFITDSNDPEDISDMATRKVKLIVKALNDGWTPNWDDSNEYKYYPWFKMSASGFSYDGYGWFTFSSVGSRLCFKNRELAKYAGTQFKEVYKKMLLT